MKKIFTILCAGILTLGLSAQTESGNMMVGINSNFNYTSDSPEGDGDAYNTMNLGGTYGYFFMDNLAGMAAISFNKSGEEDANTAFGIGARYYMGSIYAGAMYNMGAAVMGPFGMVAGEDLSSIDITAGYAHMLTDNISLEPSLSYIMNSNDGEALSSTIKLNIGFGLYF